jgi:NitT/TauT family transport system permease protein
MADSIQREEAADVTMDAIETKWSASKSGKKWGTRLMPIFSLGAFLLIWQVGVTIFDVPTYLLPKPTDVVITMVEDFDKLMSNAWVTAYEMLLGYFLAIIVAIPLAIFITISPTFDRFITPILLVSQTVPKIAIAPLFLIWFGVGPLPKILVAFLISFFPIVIDTAVGLRSVSPEMIDLVRSMGANRLQVFTRIRLPTSLPYMFSGLKVAATLAVVGAVVGEFVGADKGLGYLLLVANSYLDTPLAFASIVVLTVIGILLYYVIDTLEHWLIPWHVSRRTGAEHGSM